MTDDRDPGLRALATEAPDPDPRYLDRLHDVLAGELGLEVRRVPTAPTATNERGAGRIWRLPRPGILLLAAALTTAALAVSLVAGSPSPGPDLLAIVRARGELRIQLPTPVDAAATSTIAFDERIAQMIGERMGIAVTTTAPRDPALALVDPAVDVSIPAPWVLVDPGAFAATGPVYHVPVWVVARGSAGSFEDLAGPICTVEGSAGASWLAGDLALESSIPVAPLPPGLTPVFQPTNMDCWAGQSGGSLMVTSDLMSCPCGLGKFPIGPNGSGASSFQEGDPVLALPLAIVARRDGPDPASLLAEIDSAIAAIHEDGTLAALSWESWSRDLTVPPPTDGLRPVRPSPRTTPSA